jgi:RimJ/RimL family protein N-acetyltransferase
MTDADFVIRAVLPNDAARLLELKLALDDETSLMMLEPGERRETVRDLAAHISASLGRRNCALFVAEAQGALVGYVEAEGGEFARIRHCAYVVLGVRQAWSGQGIGGGLLRALVAWSRREGVRRLELTVRVDNERAIGLYRRCGFEVEGRRRGSLFVGGAYVDELTMARLQGPT